MGEGIGRLRRKKNDKRTRRRELRKEKLQQREEDKKLPWEERKKRLHEQKKMEKLQRRKKIATTFSILAIICMIAVIAVQLIPESEETNKRPRWGPPGGPRDAPPGGRNFNFEEWEISGNVSVPVGNPNLMGRSIKEPEEHSIVLQIMNRDSEGENEIVMTDINTDIFWIDIENETIVETSIDDIQVDSMMMVWGVQDTDGNWIATDIGMMSGMMMRPPP